MSKIYFSSRAFNEAQAAAGKQWANGKTVEECVDVALETALAIDLPTLTQKIVDQQLLNLNVLEFCQTIFGKGFTYIKAWEHDVFKSELRKALIRAIVPVDEQFEKLVNAVIADSTNPELGFSLTRPEAESIVNTILKALKEPA